jgi:hypothetical protein
MVACPTTGRYGGFNLSALPGDNDNRSTQIYIEWCQKCSVMDGANDLFAPSHVVASAAEAVVANSDVLSVCIRSILCPGWKRSLLLRQQWSLHPYDESSVICTRP